jgi:hypothetical protein
MSTNFRKLMVDRGAAAASEKDRIFQRKDRAEAEERVRGVLCVRQMRIERHLRKTWAASGKICAA